MKNDRSNVTVKDHEPKTTRSESTLSFLQQQVRHYKNANETLLALTDDITRIRNRNDLLAFYEKQIMGPFFLTHPVITLINHSNDTYSDFLHGNDLFTTGSTTSFEEMLPARFPLNEPFIQSVLNAEDPVSFLLEEIMFGPSSPDFLRLSYEKGIREMLMTPLLREGKPVGFIHVYSTMPGSFSKEFRTLLKGMAQPLASVVNNITKNEAILKNEKEKSFLLDFSREIARVRTKQDLMQAVHVALGKLNSPGGFVIRTINEDRTTMSSYVFDLSKKSDPKILNILQKARYPIDDGLQNRVMNSPIPLLLNIDREIQRGITGGYLKLWKAMGIKSTVGMRLRNREMNLGILFLDFEEINFELLQGICAQVSIALANIIANEHITKKQEEQAFLLDFSNDIALVRTKSDLQRAIFRVLDKTMHTKLAMLRVIDEDGLHLTAFMYDSTMFINEKPRFDKMAAGSISIRENYTAKVLASKEGLVFNVEEELKSGNEFARLWKSSGLRNAYGLPLRAGDKNIGTIWLLANRLSQLMLKGICAQISLAIANIQANEKLLAYKKQLEVENDYLKEQIKTINNFSEIIGSGTKMQEVYRLMSLVAESNSTVLILGETGTGKELIARVIHNESPRRDKLMVKVNCAAMPANLIESELFGHERGSFTGATDRRLGKFELANQSTLFLDEIGELPLEAQSKLLRVIQDREVERIGGEQTIKVDVRLIAATNRNLEEEVRAGRFRADLFFRLHVFPITLPPLRDRIEDIEMLTDFFVAKFSRNTGRKIRKVGPKAIRQLRSYSWPGNVRELEHLIERSILLSTGSILHDVFIPGNNAPEIQDHTYFSGRSLEEVERGYIIQILKRCAGKISGTGGAAEILKIPGNTLHSKMKKLGIGKADYFGETDLSHPANLP
jgi:formate hydrogenlyase transcriptional activator